ncbi:hypothetical protein FGO68_gene11600 [Halteria grandinella]|uniref:Fungal lipase-type domain-containing protein n=1 Tax=Halteria grandinella TaxID=5974 RepID=A0A8J8SZY2_HALGN|nr:hypothetical protein FGO68_gene11600 [Halteria grandinella]
MYYSAASHCSVDVLEKWNCGEPCEKNPSVQDVSPLINDAAGTFGFVGYNANLGEILVSFRGSVNIANWVTNINFLKEAYPGVQGAEVHSGFYEAYKGVRDQVIGSVRALQYRHPSAKFTVTGHSLGGALATFAAMDIKEQISGDRHMDLYTFGSPRTGNQQWSDYVNTQLANGGYQRITHYNDIVPHLPMTQMGFNHAGDEQWYFNEGGDLQFKTCLNTVGKGENQSCADTIILTGVAAHLEYLGHMMGGMCTSYQLGFGPQVAAEQSFLA